MNRQTNLALDAYIRARVLEMVFQKPTGFWSRNPQAGLIQARQEFPTLHARWVGPGTTFVKGIQNSIRKGLGALCSEEEVEDIFSSMLGYLATDERALGFLPEVAQDRILATGNGMGFPRGWMQKYAWQRAQDRVRRVTRDDSLALDPDVLNQSDRVAVADEDAFFQALARNPRVETLMVEWGTLNQNFHRRQLVGELLRDAGQTNIKLAATLGVTGSAVGALKRSLGAYIQQGLAQSPEFQAEVDMVAHTLVTQADPSWLSPRGMPRFIE